MAVLPNYLNLQDFLYPENVIQLLRQLNLISSQTEEKILVSEDFEHV